MNEGGIRSDPAYGKFLQFKKSILEKQPVIAFSGGMDSTFLAFVANEVCRRSLAVTVISPLSPSWEVDEALKLAKMLDLNHKVVEYNPLEDQNVATNPPDRCYHCKKQIMSRLLEIAKSHGFDTVMDGTNSDDHGAYRPGLRALAELKVVSPLAQAGLEKADIRRLSKILGLSTWNKEPMPCLATRIPYGQTLESSRLSRIDRAETCLRDLGYRVVRVRDHGDTARIELGKEDLTNLDVNDFQDKVTQRLKDLGYGYVTLDLSPYVSGSWDEALNKHR